jgi:hypothetical protein
MAPPIRLLELTSLKLEEFSFDHTPPYVAISHAWSDGLFSPGPNLVLPGMKFIHAALCTKHPNTKYCWVDTICIKQGQEQDKLEQIPLMGRIYSNAEAVVIILSNKIGINQNDVDNTSEMIRPAVEMWVEETWTQDENILYWMDGPGRHLLSSAMRGLANLTVSPWGKRVWTLQEFVLAKSVIWIGRDLEPVTINPLLFQALPGLCDQLGVFRDIGRGEGEECSILYSHFSGMANCHLNAIDRTRIMELLGNRQATVPVDEVYGVMAASGVEIQPVERESREQAWMRWCEVAISQGHIRWLMLPNLLFRNQIASRVSRLGGCGITPFQNRYLASAGSYLDTVAPLGDTKIQDHTIILSGRRVGKCQVLYKLGTVHRCTDLVLHRHLTVILFSKGKWRRAVQIAIALGAGRYGRRRILAISQIMISNYQSAVQAVKSGTELKFRPRLLRNFNAAVWGDFMQLMSLSILDLLNESSGYLARVTSKGGDINILTVAVFGDRVPKNDLTMLDFNALTGTRRRILMIAEPSGRFHGYDAGISLWHKAGTTIPMLEEFSAFVEALPIERFAIGGDSCLICRTEATTT